MIAKTCNFVDKGRICGRPLAHINGVHYCERCDAMTTAADLRDAAAKLRDPNMAGDLAPLTARQLHAIADTLDESAAQMARKIGLAADLTASEGQVGSGRPKGADEGQRGQE